MKINKNKKGVLLTLVTIVLVVLMLAEIISYVYLNINSENISSVGLVSSTSYLFTANLKNNTAGFLHTSLQNALSALVTLQNPKAGSPQINNTAFALRSLVQNGTLYGKNEISLIGYSNLLSYTNSITAQAQAENINALITNTTLSVYQENPFTINVTLTALLQINSSSGSIVYPLNATGQVFLNGNKDLYSEENNDNYTINITQAPSALKSTYGHLSIVGSPYLFSAGTLIVENTITSCTGVPSQFKNINFILVASNALLGNCGTSRFMQLQNVPGNLINGSYVFAGNSSSGSFGGYPENISSLQSAMHSGHYYPDNLTPSFLYLAQNNLTRRSQNGLFSFHLYNRLVPEFVNSKVSSYISANAVYTNTVKHISISLWFQPNFLISNTVRMGLAGENSVTNTLLYLEIKNNRIIFGSDDCSSSASYVSSTPINWSVQPNTWHNVVGIYNSSGNSLIYLDGLQIGSNSITACNSIANPYFTIGKGDKNGNYFNGSISNVQLYNITLNPSLVSKLYYDGVEGIAANTSNLTAWWELNGNTTDFSGKGRNGNVIGSNSNSMTYSYIHGYTGSPLFDGALNNNATNIVEGVMNCANINQCSNASLQHFYLGHDNLSTTFSTNGYITNALNPALFFNATLLLNVGSFNGNGYVFAPINSIFNSQYSSGAFSVFAWVYMTPNTVGPVIDIMNCNPSSSSCASTPLISVNGNTVYAGGAGITTGSFTVNTIRGWHQLTASFSGGTETLYIDGALAGTMSGTLSPSSGSSFYWSTGCGSSCSPPAGVSNTLYGKIADVQILDSGVASGTAKSLYLNNTCGTSFVCTPSPPSSPAFTADSWSLSAPFDGLANQTYVAFDTEYGSSIAYFANRQGICTAASVIENTCGAIITQP